MKWFVKHTWNNRFNCHVHEMKRTKPQSMHNLCSTCSSCLAISNVIQQFMCALDWISLNGAWCLMIISCEWLFIVGIDEHEWLWNGKWQNRSQKKHIYSLYWRTSSQVYCEWKVRRDTRFNNDNLTDRMK